MQYRIDLTNDEVPTKWYNINADLPVELPAPKNSEGRDQISTLPTIFVNECLNQEFSTERYINIPNNTVSIMYQAFDSCYGLKYANVHSNTKTIGEGAFDAGNYFEIRCNKGSAIDTFAQKNNIIRYNFCRLVTSLSQVSHNHSGDITLGHGSKQFLYLDKILR